MIHFTMRCQHRCEHCYVNFEHGGVRDMPDSVLDMIIEKCARARLLGNVTLIGGEPFIDPPRFLAIVEKIWHAGAGTFEIFVPTNGRWVMNEDWQDIVKRLIELGNWIPYSLRIAFSKNKWNLAQLGGLAPEVSRRWMMLEDNWPHIFYHREVKEDELLPLGRAEEHDLARPSAQVGVNCSFDDWYDPAGNNGFLTDYLAFYPNGGCGLCYVYHSPVIGSIDDDLGELLSLRREYLIALRLRLTGEPFGVLNNQACRFCREFFPQWLAERGNGRGD